MSARTGDFIPGVRHALEKLWSNPKYVAARDAYYEAGRPEGFYDSAEAEFLDRGALPAEEEGHGSPAVGR